MQLRYALTVGISGACAGTGLWFTRASLDVTTGPQGEIRVALLPPLWLLIAYVLLGCLAAAALDLLILGIHRRRGGLSAAELSAHPFAAAAGPILPLACTILLALPYLPFVPDRLPILRVLAGPARYLLWGIVLASAAWMTAVAVMPTGGAPFTNQKPSRLHRLASPPLLIFAASLLYFGFAASRLTNLSPFPTGDEPHYMVIMQSLLRDGDLKIENNHALEQYKEYFPRPLRPHFIARGADGEIYSIHPIGMPVLAAPAFAIAGYRGVVAFLVLCASLAAAIMWKWVVSATGSEHAATFAWAAACLTSPYAFNTFTVYPEIVGALCVMLALAWRPSGGGAETSDGRLEQLSWFVKGIATGLLPWLSTKYAPMAAAVGLICLWRARRKVSHALCYVLPCALSLAGWFSYFSVVYGALSPSAPYGRSHMTKLSNALSGVPGLFFDQEFGVLMYAPVLILGLTGLAAMLRCAGEARRLAIEIILVFGVLLLTVGSFEIWGGGSAAPGRPLTSGLLLLAVPIAWRFRESSSQPLQRSSHVFLLVASLSITMTLLFAERGWLIVSGRKGPSELLRWLSPSWQLWSVFPSYIYHDALIATSHVLLWLLPAALLAWGIRRSRLARPGAATCLVMGGAALLIIAISAMAPWLLGARAQPGADLRARSHASILDQFDSRARPTGIVYDPFREVPASAIPRTVTLVAAPGLHTDPQPVQLLWNARFSLPAGEYTVEVVPAGARPLHGDLSVRIGRIGDPLLHWSVQTDAATAWKRQLKLPIDVDLIGFAATPELEACEIHIAPVSIRDLRDRLPFLPVLSARSYGNRTYFFHDENVFPQSGDIWTRGQSIARITIMDESSGGLRWVLQSGMSMPITLESGNWSEQLTLEKDREAVVTPPVSRAGVPFRVVLRTKTGYVPMEIDPSTRDRRFMGFRIATP